MLPGESVFFSEGGVAPKFRPGLPTASICVKELYVLHVLRTEKEKRSDSRDSQTNAIASEFQQHNAAAVRFLL